MAERPPDPYARFKSFEPLFGPETYYLKLLNLGDGVARTVALVRDAVGRSPDLSAELTAMFENPNWRLHLVAAMALLVRKPTPEQVGLLWGAIDRPSWVCPQLAATAFVVDTDFAEKARSRIERRCPLNLDAATALSPLERHVVLGPPSGLQHSAKLLSALLDLCALLPDTGAWLSELREEAEIREMIASDPDEGGAIATHWLDGIRKELALA